MTNVNQNMRYSAGARERDKRYPFQVALPDDFCCMENFTTISRFCERFPYSVPTTKIRTVWADRTQVEMRLHCFASQADADVFAAAFDGEHFQPKRDRRKGAWRRTDDWHQREHYGPLQMPKFFRENP